MSKQPVLLDAGAAVSRRDAALAAAAAAMAKTLALLFAVVGIYQIGTGLVTAFVPIKLASSGAPPSVLGWVSTGFSVGFLAGCMVASTPLNWLGPNRAIAAFAGLNTVAALMIWATPDPAVWAVARGLSGFVGACLFVLIEAWLAQATSGARRGAVFGFYMILSRLAFTLGQIAVVFVDPASGMLFLVAAAAYALSPWAAFAVPGTAPTIGAKSGPNLVDLPSKVPAAAIGSLAHGLITTVGPALFPVYALARGFTVEEVALLLAAIPFGGLVLQLPFAMLSDRIGRRSVMAIVAAITALSSLPFLLPQLPPFAVIMVLTALWGGVPAPLYSLAVAHANDIATDAERVGWSSTLLLLWGIGAAGGPLAASFLMERLGYNALFWFTGGLSLALCAFLLLRKLLRKRFNDRAPAGETIGPAPGPSG